MTTKTTNLTVPEILDIIERVESDCHGNVVEIMPANIWRSIRHWLTISGPDVWSLAAGRDEMLEALKGVVRVADRNTVEFDAARAAIAKSTGDV